MKSPKQEDVRVGWLTRARGGVGTWFAIYCGVGKLWYEVLYIGRRHPGTNRQLRDSRTGV